MLATGGVHTVETVVGLLAVIALLGVVANRARLPYPTILVLGGIVLGIIPGVPEVRLNPQLVLFGFIPMLVYAASFRAASFDLRAHAVQIISLSTGLVLLTVVAAGAVVHLISGIPWAASFVFGALSAPTDPVSASAVMGEVGAPDSIVAILEGESLINDGTGLAVFQVAVAAVAGGFSPGHGAIKLIEISAGGIAIGLVVGWLSVRIRRPLDAPSIEIVLSLLAAFGSYSAAAASGFSGVLAAVTAGVYAGWHAHDISTPDSRLRMEPVWDAVTFIAESILFLLIGLQLPAIVDGIKQGQTATAGLTAAAAVATLLALRWLWITSVSPLFARLVPGHSATSWRDILVLSWSGMRGALSLAGALSIPLIAGGQPFPSRDEVIFLVYCVVLGTLIVPSFTLKPLLRRLGLAQNERLREEELKVRGQIAHAALAQLEHLAEEREISDEILAQLRGVYSLRLSRLESSRKERDSDADSPASLEQVQEIRGQLLAAQRRALAEIRAARNVGTEVLARVERDIDLDETRFRSGH